MKIPAINFSLGYTKQIKKENNPLEKSPLPENSSTELRSQFNDHLVAFGARVDKGMNRFFNENKDRMPERVRNLVEPLPNRELITPLEAQYYAYKNLEEAVTVKDIKEKFYPDEKLFANLKEVSESKAPTGLIHTLNEMSEVYPDGVLQTKEDMTVYLVKKVFLEAKTIDEINQDLENDLDEDFKVYYKDKKQDATYVRSSTLNALGIRMPDASYLQSLRYTRDGYSDLVGANISKGLYKFFSKLSPEQKTARAVRLVREIEKWWNSLTIKEKIELIAKKEAQLEMLKAYKKSRREEQKKLKELGIENDTPTENTPTEPKHHTKVGSKELKQDELFKMWATLNLKIFEESLTQADKDTLYLSRMANQVSRWKEMSAAERTEYISKMKAGTEPVRFTMIDAWNNSPEIIKALYLHLKENQVYKPADLLYSTDEFSQFQSKVMTEFWANNPDFAENLGNRILTSKHKIEQAINNGTFDALKNEINRNKNIRKKELEAFKKSLEIPTEPQEPAKELDYKDEFKIAYSNSILGQISSTPKNYFADVYEKGLETLSEESVRIWTKVLNQDKSISTEELETLKNALNFRNTQEIMIYNHAYESAIADCLYTATKDPVVFGLNSSHIKSAIYQLERGENPIKITDPAAPEDLSLTVDKKFKGIDKERINHLYETYKREISEEELQNIIKYNFIFYTNSEEQEPKTTALKLALIAYLKTYGKTLNIAYSDKSAFPIEARKAFALKVKENLPLELKNFETFHALDIGDTIDLNIGHAKTLFGARFRFLPKEVLEGYFKEFRTILKTMPSDFDISQFITRVGRKRISIKSHGTVAPMPKSVMQDDKVKYQMLAIEQALADVLYEASGNENVYKIDFEYLCDKLELYSFAKEFPFNGTQCPTVDGFETTIVLNKKINYASIQKKYKEYMREINEWISETNNSKPDYKELLYILNPEENNITRDINVAERIVNYFPDLSEIDFELLDKEIPVKFSKKPTDQAK